MLNRNAGMWIKLPLLAVIGFALTINFPMLVEAKGSQHKEYESQKNEKFHSEDIEEKDGHREGKGDDHFEDEEDDDHAEKSKSRLKLTKAEYKKSKGELSVKVSAHLPVGSYVLLYDAISGALLAEVEARGRQVSFTLSENIACVVRVSAGEFEDTEKVKHAPSYCDDEGLSVLLTGQVQTGGNIAVKYARVSTEIDGFVFSSITDEEGFYELNVRGENPGSFVTLSAQGSGDQNWIFLQSLIGELGNLTLSGGSASAQDNSFEKLLTDATAFLGNMLVPHAHAQSSVIKQAAINNLTTALYVILTQSNGGAPPVTQADVDALVAQANPLEIVQLAAAISLVSSAADLPAGASSLADVVADPTLASTLVENTDDALLRQAIADITSNPDLFPGISPALILGVNYEARIGGINDPTAIILFEEDGRGERKSYWDTQSFSWIIDESGKLILTYDQPNHAALLGNIGCMGPVGSEDCPMLLQSTYSLIAESSGSAAFFVLHEYGFSDPGYPGGSLTDTPNFVRDNGLVALSQEMFEGKTYGTLVGTVKFNGYWSAATRVNFYASGTGMFESGNVAQDTWFDWSIVGDNALVISYTANDIQGNPGLYKVTYRILGSVGKALQTVVLTEYPGGAREVSPGPMIVSESGGFAIGEGVGRYRLVNSPYDKTSSRFILQFDSDGTGVSQSFLDESEQVEDCYEDPFTWTLEGGELVARYYRLISDQLVQLANCPPELEGITCYQIRERRVDLLSADVDYNYVINWQQFTSPDGSVFLGPQTYIGIHERLELKPTRCWSFPDAPLPVPDYGSYSFVKDFNGVQTISFDINPDGSFRWVFYFGQPEPVVVDGLFDTSRSYLNTNLGGFTVGFTLSDEGHLVGVGSNNSNPEPNPSYAFAARQGLPVSPYAGAFYLPPGPLATTRRFTVDTANNIVWEIDLGGESDLIETRLQESGTFEVLSFRGVNIYGVFTDYNNFDIRVIDSNGVVLSESSGMRSP